LGLIALCLISSSNYIINDIADREKDRNNTEKRLRPIASGKVSVWKAAFIALIVLSLGLCISFTLSPMFLMLGAALFLLTQAYTFKLKNEVFADILVISTNFVIRTVSGAFVTSNGFHPYVEISPWLILCPFFLALFLAVSKRRSEAFLLKKASGEHREVLKSYNSEITSALMIIATALFVACYSLYTFFSPYPRLLLTIPFALYIIFRLFQATESGEKISRHPELLFRDKGMIFTGLIIMLIILISIYF